MSWITILLVIVFVLIILIVGVWIFFYNRTFVAPPLITQFGSTLKHPSTNSFVAAGIITVQSPQEQTQAQIMLLFDPGINDIILPNFGWELELEPNQTFITTDDTTGLATLTDPQSLDGKIITFKNDFSGTFIQFNPTVIVQGGTNEIIRVQDNAPSTKRYFRANVLSNEDQTITFESIDLPNNFLKIGTPISSSLGIVPLTVGPSTTIGDNIFVLGVGAQ